MDAFENLPASGLVVKSTPIWGPAKYGDAEIVPLIAGLIAHISSAGINLQNFAIGKTDERAASRRLSALTALIAAGELRAIIALCTMGLALESRIHVRTLDDCLRRIAVYWSDAAAAAAIEATIPDFQADGMKKLSAADRDRLTIADEAFAQRYDALTTNAKKPMWITEHPKYEKQPVGLDSFTRWAYSQVEHASPIALVEVSNRLSLISDQIYATDDVVQLSITSIGVGLSIIAFLAGWGVATMRDTYISLEERLEEVLKRSGLYAAEPPDDANTQTT